MIKKGDNVEWFEGSRQYSGVVDTPAKHEWDFTGVVIDGTGLVWVPSWKINKVGNRLNLFVF